VFSAMPVSRCLVLSTHQTEGAAHTALDPVEGEQLARYKDERLSVKKKVLGVLRWTEVCGGMQCHGVNFVRLSCGGGRIRIHSPGASTQNRALLCCSSGGIMTTAVCLSSRLLLGTAVARKCVELFDAALVVALLDSTDSFSWLPSICWGGVGCSALRSGLASCVV
jgi:hypothetical protein